MVFLQARDEGNWREYPYLVNWVNEAIEWAETYGIERYIRADEAGQDPSGQINEDENLSQIGHSFVWTWWGEPDHVTSTELGVGPFSKHIFGWFIGSKPKPLNYTSLQFTKEICGECEGEHSIQVTENDDEAEVECQTCAGGSDAVYVFLDNTDFWNTKWTG